MRFQFSLKILSTFNLISIIIINFINIGKVINSKNSTSDSNNVNSTIDSKVSSFTITTEQFYFGEDGVIVQHQRGNKTDKIDGDLNYKGLVLDDDDDDQSKVKISTIDISPASCSTQCFPGSFEPPHEDHCDTIINSLLSNSTGSLEAKPRSWVYIYFKTCVAVFENPDVESPPIQINWAILGKLVDGLRKNCLNSISRVRTVGGTCIYDRYREIKFSNVEVSLKRLSIEEEGEYSETSIHQI
ncbi:hypothetical protein BY996DRAFT_6787255 [Phakopsora pachyrhizi]|nr:hypothetical protein BY996DRAFT_6787255 [Phakopsora pachyrhizi]